MKQQLPKGGLLAVLESIDHLLSDSGVGLSETSEELVISLEKPCETNLLDLARGVLASLWQASTQVGGLFELTIIMRRGNRQELLRLYEDCSHSPTANVFGDSWNVCKECARLLDSLGEIYSTHDYGNAPLSAVRLVTHLAVCRRRRVSVRLEITVKKKTLSGLARTEAGQPRSVSLEFWYELENFYSWLAKLTPWDFFHRYAQKTETQYVVVVHHPGSLEYSEYGAFVLIPTSVLASLSDASRTAKRESDIGRIRQEAEGLANEIVLKDTPLIPPGIILLNVRKPDIERSIPTALSKILAYSIFCLVSDYVQNAAGTLRFSKDLPYGTRSVDLKFAADQRILTIDVGGTARIVPQKEWIEKTVDIYTNFCELPGRGAYKSLRKTAVSELLKLKFGDIVDLVLEKTSLLTYYATLRKELLERRIDDLAAVMEKLSDSATKSSTSISQMLESMQHDISNLSMVLLGALLLQMYSYVSKAVNVEQLILLLLSSGIVSSFLLLLIDFRLSDIEDAGVFTKQTFFSLEQTIFQVTGLRVTAWQELVERSHKMLEKRIEIMDTMTWGVLTCDMAVIYYILLKLVEYGYGTTLSATAGTATSAIFCAELFLVRKTRSGFGKLRGRTSMGTFLVLASLTILMVGTSVLIVRSWPDILLEMRRALG